jgi:hypothetical protein
MMEKQTLERLRNDIAHMDRVELLAFGRQHRANPESIEYQEARAEWQRRIAKDKERKPEPTMPPPSSDELAEMARKAGPGRYPWIRYDD